MAEEQKNGNSAATAEREKIAGAKTEAEQSEFVLTIKVKRSGSSEDVLLDYPCKNLNATSLAEVVNSVRKLFQVGDSAAVRVLTSANQMALDQNVPLNMVLSKLQTGDQLIVQIDSLEEDAGAEGKARHFQRDILFYTKPAGEVEQKITGLVNDQLRAPAGGYVLLREELLENLTEKVERPLMLASVCLFLGVTLGAIVSILLALADDNLPLMTRERLRGAFVVSAIAALFLFILGYFVKAESKKAIRPVTDLLSGKGKKR